MSYPGGCRRYFAQNSRCFITSIQMAKELRAKVGDGQAADEIAGSRPSMKMTPVLSLGNRCFASIARQRF